MHRDNNEIMNGKSVIFFTLTSITILYTNITSYNISLIGHSVMICYVNRTFHSGLKSEKVQFGPWGVKLKYPFKKNSHSGGPCGDFSNRLVLVHTF